MRIYSLLILGLCLFLSGCGSSFITKSEIIATENLPSARHENGFVNVNGLFYLIGVFSPQRKH